MNAARGSTVSDDKQASENQATDAQANENGAPSQDGQRPHRIDPEFFSSINEYLELAHKQAARHGPKRVSLAALYGAARFNALVYLDAADGEAAAQRGAFLDYMTDMYRRVLNEHLDSLGAEHGIDVGESELAEEYKANGYVPGKGFVGTAEA
jgi:hypothetical protein